MTELKTFIVEDSPVILETLAATLEELAGVRVIGSAADEQTAVDWLTRSPPACDLLIIDIFLSAGSGLGVLRAAAAKPQPIRCIVLTNYATPEMREKCLQMGADRVFDKSDELDELIDYCGDLADGLSRKAGTTA